MALSGLAPPTALLRSTFGSPTFAVLAFLTGSSRHIYFTIRHLSPCRATGGARHFLAEHHRSAQGASGSGPPIWAENVGRVTAPTYNSHPRHHTTRHLTRHPQMKFPLVAAQNPHCASGRCRFWIRDSSLGSGPSVAETPCSSANGRVSRYLTPGCFAKTLTSTCFNTLAAADLGSRAMGQMQHHFTGAVLAVRCMAGWA